MSQQYFFMFSSGSYSEYGVCGIYICDHPVTEEEWKVHYQAYYDEGRKLYSAIPQLFWREHISYEERLQKSPEFKAYDDWCKANEPVKIFTALHRMTEVPYLELWHGD